MLKLPDYQGPSFGGIAVYRIVIQGFLQANYGDYLAGMTIAHLPNGQTELVGQVCDQSALSGVLNALVDLHLPLVLVEYLGAHTSKLPPSQL